MFVKQPEKEAGGGVVTPPCAAGDWQLRGRWPLRRRGCGPSPRRSCSPAAREGEGRRAGEGAHHVGPTAAWKRGAEPCVDTRRPRDRERSAKQLIRD